MLASIRNLGSIFCMIGLYVIKDAALHASLCGTKDYVSCFGSSGSSSSWQTLQVPHAYAKVFAFCEKVCTLRGIVLLHFVGKFEYYEGDQCVHFWESLYIVWKSVYILWKCLYILYIIIIHIFWNFGTLNVQNCVRSL